MSHQPLPHQPAAVGQALREVPRLRVEEQSRGADAVAGHDHDTRPLLGEAAIGIVVQGAARQSCRVDGDLPAPGPASSERRRSGWPRASGRRRSCSSPRGGIPGDTIRSSAGRVADLYAPRSPPPARPATSAIPACRSRGSGSRRPCSAHAGASGRPAWAGTRGCRGPRTRRPCGRWSRSRARGPSSRSASRRLRRTGCRPRSPKDAAWPRARRNGPWRLRRRCPEWAASTIRSDRTGSRSRSGEHPRAAGA